MAENDAISTNRFFANIVWGKTPCLFEFDERHKATSDLRQGVSKLLDNGSQYTVTAKVDGLRIMILRTFDGSVGIFEARELPTSAVKNPTTNRPHVPTPIPDQFCAWTSDGVELTSEEIETIHRTAFDKLLADEVERGAAKKKNQRPEPRMYRMYRSDGT